MLIHGKQRHVLLLATVIISQVLIRNMWMKSLVGPEIAGEKSLLRQWPPSLAKEGTIFSFGLCMICKA